MRTRAAEISLVGRNTQGVTLMRLADAERLQALERLDGSLDEDDGEVPSIGSGASPGAEAMPAPEA